MARPRVVGKPSERNYADTKSKDLEVTLKVRPSNSPKELRFLGIETGLLGEDEFQLIFKDVYDKKRELLRAIIPNAIDFMSIEDFVTLLKNVGVKENIAEEVGRKIEQSHFSVTVAQDEVVFSVPGTKKVFTGNPTPVPTTQEPKGKHSARVIQERHGTGLIETDGAAIPTTWDDAKAAVPGLRKWVDVKREVRAANPGRSVYDSLVEHLRNPVTGLGKWTTTVGLPKRALRKIDESLRQEILGSKVLPSDIKLLDGNKGRPRIADTPTSEEVREARRISALGARRGM